MSEDLCPYCQGDQLQAGMGCGLYTINGKDEIVDGIEYMTCTDCWAQVILPEQVEKNAKTIDAITQALEWGA